MTDMKYVRLFAAPDGESPFEDVKVELSSEAARVTQGDMFLVAEWQSVERMRFSRLPPFPFGLAHHAPARLFQIVLAGSWAVQTSDGEIRHFHPGDAILVGRLTPGLPY
jgi:hypothetical protein